MRNKITEKDAKVRENIFNAVKAAYKAIDDKFGKDIIVLDVAEVSIMADFFMIATAANPNQLRAIKQAVDEQMHLFGINMKHSEGLQSARWILLDFGSVVVHLFCEEERSYYNLERIWADARKVTVEELTK